MASTPNRTIIKYVEPLAPINWTGVMQKLAQEFNQRRKPDRAAFIDFCSERIAEILNAYRERFLTNCTQLLWQGHCTIHDHKLALYQEWTAEDYANAATLSYFEGENDGPDPEPNITLPTPIDDDNLMTPPSFCLRLLDEIVDDLELEPEQRRTWRLENKIAWERYPHRALDAMGWLLCLLPAYMVIGQPDPATYLDYLATTPTLLDLAPLPTPPTPTPAKPVRRIPVPTSTIPPTPQLTLF